MSGTVSFSQTGIPAVIQVVPGPGVGFAGQGADGVGVAGASLDGAGQLVVLRTDGVSLPVGRVGRVVANVAASGTGQADGTVLTADVSLVQGGAPGGCLVLSGGPNASRRVINKTDQDWPVYPPAGLQIDALGAGAAFVVAAGTSDEFHCPDGISWGSEP